MVVTNDPDKAEKLRVLRGHGSKPKYHHALIGGNFRLDALQAAVLSVKFQYLDEWSAARQANASWYSHQIQNCELSKTKLLEAPAAIWEKPLGDPLLHRQDRVKAVHYHIFNQYVISTPHRDKLQQHMQQKEIGTAIYYPIPLHLQRCFRYLGYQPGDFPVSESAANTTLAIPVYPELNQEQRQYIMDTILSGIRTFAA